MKKIYFSILIVILCLGTTQKAAAQIDIVEAYPGITFDDPLDFQHAGDGTNNVYVVERNGVIKKLENTRSANSAEVFLDISYKIDTGGEGGLLGLAFHPDFSENSYFYVYYTYDDDGQFTTSVSRFEVDDATGVADEASEFKIIEIEQPATHHNGGQIAFGPDGMLYVALGEGGGKETDINAQDRTNLHGSILRINVDEQDPGLNYAIPVDNPFAGNSNGWREEIFAYGLRNPWRFSFDSETGELWLADVGEGIREEVNIIEAGKNYGWNTWEGTHCILENEPCTEEGFEFPIFEYRRDVGKSITGGFVYRGSQLPGMQGRYIYGDFVNGKIWSFDWDGVNASDNQEIESPIGGYNLVSFGQDKDGEIYICSFDGNIYKVVPEGVTQFEIPGTEGTNNWRFLGTSRINESYQSLLSNVWTQGIAGADKLNGEPNIYTWDEEIQEFTVVDDLNNEINNGQGFAAFLFEDDDPSQEGLQGGWPKTLTSTGTEQRGPVNLPVTYTNGSDSEVIGFNLVANPYDFSIDWTASSGWSKENINDAIYIWDPNANNGTGAYKQWVDGLGDPIHLIAPYQAFFVQANGADPVLRVTESVQEEGGTFLKSEQESSSPRLTFSVQTGGFKDNAYFAFREKATYGKDTRDALELASLADENMQLFSITPDSISLAINSLPATLQRKINIPMALETTINGSYNLNWTASNIPAQWEMVLHDRTTGEKINLRQEESYHFEVVQAQPMQKTGDQNRVLPDNMHVMKSKQDSRFMLSVGPEDDTRETASDIPTDFVLNQNFPNPFNPSTVIRFGLPQASQTTLKVYNILGQQVRTLVNRELEAGYHEIDFNAAGLSSGTYIYQITAEGFTSSKKMVILK